MSEVRIGMIVSRVRVEEKMLLASFQKRGLSPEVINDEELVLDPISLDPEWHDYDLVLQRSVSATRGLYILRILETWGVPTLNNYDVSATCSDKLLTTLALARANVPQPDVRLAFSPDSALCAVDEIGFPAVLKPVQGSWGRLLARVDDRYAMEAVLEHRHTLGSFPYHVDYVQAYIDKTLGRDIRAFVVGGVTICAIYRSSPHWITNTARGGVASNCPVTPELDRLCKRASDAVGGGVVAIDVFETDEGLLVNEINHTMEFRNSVEPTGVDIADEMVNYALGVAIQIQASRGVLQ